MKKTASALSLRAFMLLLVGLLVVIALLFAASHLRQSLVTYHNALRLAERNNVSDGCIQAVKNFAVERGRSHVILHSRDPVSPENRHFIDERRAASDRHINDILNRLSDDSRTAGDAVRQAWAAVKTLRSGVDRDFNLNPAGRDPSLPGQWMSEANRLVAGLESVLISLSTPSGNTDASFDRLSALRVLSLQLRNIVGSESTLFVSALSSGRLPGREVADALHELRGRSLQIWSQLEPGMLKLSDPVSTAAVERVRSELFSRLHSLQDEIIHESELGTHASFVDDHYLKSSLSALDSTIELSDGINRLAQAYTTSRLVQARKDATTSIAGIAAILLLACFSALVMANRFTRPLNGVLRRIDSLLRTHSASLLPVTSTVNRDEFGKVQQALESLDEAIEARWQSEVALHASERISASILACIPQSVIATDLNGLITGFSTGAEHMLGYSAAEVVGKQTLLLFHDQEEVRLQAERLSKKLGRDVNPDFKVLVARMEIEGQPDEQEWTYIRKDGVRIAVILSITSLRNANGDIDGCLGVATDITERKMSEHKLLDSARELGKQNSLLSALLETIPVGVFMVEAPSGTPLVTNDAARLLLGRGVFPGVHEDNLSEIYAAYKLPSRVPYPVNELPLVMGMEGLSSHVEDMLVVGPDGTERILEVMGSPVKDGEGRVWASVVSFIDITGRSQSTAEMAQLAHYDALTRLPNRRLFHDRMQMAVTQARRDKSRLALMMIDLDRFKPVNDNLGHAVGDLLLKAVAGRMQLCLRESDTLARVGGDEFFVILPGIVTEHDALGVAEKIRQVLNEPFDLEGGYRVSIACSVGIAIYPEHGQDEKWLSKNADAAMYTAKESGRNRVHIFRGVSAKRPIGSKRSVDHPILHLVWHKSYKCGEPSIDQEHHELFDLANKLISASVSGVADPAHVSSALEELIACVVKHFANEEIVLANYRYDGLADHALKHQRLIGLAHELRRMAADGELSLGDLVVFIAQEVVVLHMLHEDKKYFEFLRTAMKNERDN